MFINIAEPSFSQQKHISPDFYEIQGNLVGIKQASIISSAVNHYPEHGFGKTGIKESKEQHIKLHVCHNVIIKDHLDGKTQSIIKAIGNAFILLANLLLPAMDRLHPQLMHTSTSA